MKIAVTGGTGFVGRYLLEHLTRRGQTCRCWYRPDSDRTGLEPLGDSVQWVAGELGDRGAADALVEGCEAVVHSALHHPGGGFRGGEGDVVAFAEKNILGTLALIEAARRRGVERFVYISTCAVHERILDDRPLDETHPLWPTSHYGAHKAALEAFVHSYGLGEGYPICAVRPCGVYGLAHPPERSKWFDLVRDVVQGETVDCRRGGKEVHAADVARAVELLLTAEGIAGEAFSCCDRYVSHFEVAQLARRIAGSDARIDGGPTTPRHQIETGKLRALGMQFGGTPLLEASVTQLVDAVRG